LYTDTPCFVCKTARSRANERNHIDVSHRCGACGTDLRANARFCDACGAVVTEMDSQAEYKQVTVLFADVVHSMDIAAYNLAIDYGVLRADDAAVHVCEEAVRAAGSSHDVALFLAEYTLAVALLDRDTAADRRRGQELMEQCREYVSERYPFLVPVVDLAAARATARRGERDAAIAVMHQAVDELHQAGRLAYGGWGTGVLVETLLERGADGDLDDAQEAMDWLARQSATADSGIWGITLLRLRALLAQARRDDRTYREMANRYLSLAKSLGFEGHMTWAEAMP